MQFLGCQAVYVLSHCDGDVWWACWLLQRLNLWFLPNTRHYSVFIHSCPAAVQPQSSAVRHWAALWSYWNSGLLLRASNKMLFETMDAGRLTLNSFVVQVNQQSDSESGFLWVCWNDILHFCTFVIGVTVILPCIITILPKILWLCLTLDLLLRLNVMLFKLSYSPLINNEWRLTVCLVKSSASNVSSLLRGAVDQGERNRLHERSCLTFRPYVCTKYL